MKKLLSYFLVAFMAVPMLAKSAVPAYAQSTGTETAPQFCYTFTKNMGEGRPVSSADAQALTVALINAGVWNTEAPIITYNDVVASAVSGFQEKYAAQILTPNGLSYGTGYVGASTRAELNALYGGCSSSTTTTSSGSQSYQCPSGWVCTPPASTPAPVYSCPTGWTCTPTTGTTPTIPITNPVNPTPCATCVSGSQPLVIWNLTTPAAGTLAVGETGTWAVNAYGPQNATWNYSVNWGDRSAPTTNVQTPTFIHAYTTSGNYTVTFTVTDSAGLTAQATSTVNVSNVVIGTSGVNYANVSRDSATPAAGTVNVTNITQGQYLGLPVLTFDVGAQGANLHLHAVTVNMNGASNSGNGSITAAYLYQGAIPVASASIVNDIANFVNITDGQAGATLPANISVPYTVKVDVSGLTAPGVQLLISASVTGLGTTVYNPNDYAVSVNGSANGNTITVNQ